jgi:hypothetical protein
VIPFRPRKQQLEILDMIYRRGLKKIVILKARQIGFSTLLGIICTDQLCWTAGKQLSLVDKTQADTQQKLKNISVLAYDSLPQKLKDRFVVSRANVGEFGVRFIEYGEAQVSTLWAGTHCRGGANSMVWISDWGLIQSEDLKRSEEILTGAIPSAKDGLVVCETTWRGGKGGHLWDIVKKALEMPEEQKHVDDWRICFFPWSADPLYCDAEPQALKEETIRYFADKPGHSLGQQSWYQRARDQYQLFIKREFPTVMEEMFQTPIEGAIFAELIDRLRAQGAIRSAEVDTVALVHTAWDLGAPLNVVTWYFQLVGTEIRVIYCDSGLDLTPVQRVSRMLNKGYLFGSHYLPHDSMATQKSGRTFLNELNEIGLRNCKVVPRVSNVWIGIDRLRGLLPRFTFRIPACERGLEAVSNYRAARTTSTGLAVDEPVHDWASHAASALKVIAEAESAGMLSRAGISGGVTRRQPVRVVTGYRGNDYGSAQSSILDKFFGPQKGNVRVLR